MDKSIKALGLMSGTSLDGIDASIIDSDGEKNIEIIKNQYFKYPLDFKKKLFKYISQIITKDDVLNNISEFNILNRELTIFHSLIASELIKNSNKDIEIVGFHGQTIIHRPNEGYSLQMGDPNLLSLLLKKRVVFDFRKNDIKHKGEGAPLTPIYHFNLSKKLGLNYPIVFLNIGGISNFTYCENESFYAKDIGPGNVLIDNFIKKKTNFDFDKNGEIAETGTVDINIINQFIEHEIYNSKNKHSYDIKDFDFNFVRGLSVEDAAATLTYFTAKIIANFIQNNFKNKINIILCGGGRKNLTLQKNINDLVNHKVVNIDDLGIDGDYIESQAFAYLAIRSYLNKNLSFPTTTQVSKPVTGGQIFKNF